MASRPTQKVRIRREAARLWARQGYHATGIKELSEVVGLGRAALYHHIGSKEELLFEISTLYVEQLIERAQLILSDDDARATEKLKRMSRGLMRNIADNLPEWTVFFREANTLTGAHRVQMVAQRARYEELWAVLVEQGVETGELRSSDSVIVKGLLGMHNYSYLWLQTRDRLTAEQIADEFTSVILRGLLSDQRLSEIIDARRQPAAAPRLLAL
jgi:AcrR family transcriptional regulator